MVHRSSSRRRNTRTNAAGPFIAFLLVASFGILFAGCKGPEDVNETADFVFTEENLTQAHQLAQNAMSGAVQKSSTSSSPYLEPLEGGTAPKNSDVVLDLSMVNSYNSIRVGNMNTTGKEIYFVSFDFLNVREKPSSASALVTRLNYGDAVEVMSFANAGWAQVKITGGIVGYVTIKYIAKMTTEDKLASEKAKFDGQFYVNYSTVNLRKDKDLNSEKLAEIPGQTIVKVNGFEGEWAKITFDGKTGYANKDYLSAFLPNFIIRQNEFTLPVLHYKMTKGQEETTVKQIVDHVSKIKAAGYKLTTFKKFRDQLVDQQRRNNILSDTQFIVAITGVTSENVRAITDALDIATVDATLFLETKHLGLSGITQKALLTLIANGFDIQSATHTGDDLRSLTNAQMDLELKQSRKIIEDMTGRQAIAVAYPQGGANDRVMQFAGLNGYLLGLSTGSDRTFTRDQLLAIPGIDVFPTMSSEELMKQVTGK